MNSHTFTDFGNRWHDAVGRGAAREAGSRAAHSDDPPLVIQILSVIGFGVFSIVAVSLAFAAFWVAGFVVTLLIAWTWAGSRVFGGRRNPRAAHLRQTVSDVAPPVLDRRGSGNSSFDAYRAEMLTRLERESEDFDAFLSRLRTAHDAREFDTFLDERARTARQARDDGIDEAEIV
jgi:hypothetical protein